MQNNHVTRKRIVLCADVYATIAARGCPKWRMKTSTVPREH